jgi:hypothetical protein
MWLVINMGRQGLAGLQISRGAKNRRSVDGSSLQLAPPAETKEMITALNSLEFHRLGELPVKLPENKVVTVWVLVNSDDTIQAETVYDRISFSSFFQEDVLLVTDYPTGERIEIPRYQSHFVAASINDAYRHHLEQLELFTRKYGTPHTIQSMHDYLHWETMGRVHYGDIKLKRFTIVDTVRVAICVYAVIVCVAVPLLYKYLLLSNTMPDAGNGQAQMELLIIALILPFLFVPPILTGWLKSHLYKKTDIP